MLAKSLERYVAQIETWKYHVDNATMNSLDKETPSPKTTNRFELKRSKGLCSK